MGQKGALGRRRGLAGGDERDATPEAKSRWAGPISSARFKVGPLGLLSKKKIRSARSIRSAFKIVRKLQNEFQKKKSSSVFKKIKMFGEMPTSEN
jgi:hypothetical protein